MLFKNLDSFHCPKCQKRQIQICILPFPINQLPWTMFHVPYSMFHLLFTNFHVPLMIYHLHFTIYHFPCSTYDLPLHFIFYHLPFTIYQLRFNIYPKSQDSDREQTKIQYVDIRFEILALNSRDDMCLGIYKNVYCLVSNTTS